MDSSELIAKLIDRSLQWDSSDPQDAKDAELDLIAAQHINLQQAKIDLLTTKINDLSIEVRSLNLDLLVAHSEAMGLYDSQSHNLENSDEKLTNVHSPNQCAGENCTIHNMSDHHMRTWPQHWRSDRGIMERICSHGIGHPDPDNPWSNDDSNWIHGCDGCCKES
jgi:hypothetical protein